MEAIAIAVAVGGIVLFFAIPWAECAYYWLRAPSHRVKVLERELRTMRRKYEEARRGHDE